MNKQTTLTVISGTCIGTFVPLAQAAMHNTIVPQEFHYTPTGRQIMRGGVLGATFAVVLDFYRQARTRQ